MDKIQNSKTIVTPLFPLRNSNLDCQRNSGAFRPHCEKNTSGEGTPNSALKARNRRKTGT